ncbi:MAG TPA: hypothetical protein VIT67_02735 [Povalibacter sp.]
MSIRLSTAITSMAGLLLCTAAANAGDAKHCKAVRADVQEVRTLENCTTSFCTEGTIDGNHGLSGTTFFSAEGGAATPPGSPGTSSYTGVFTITTEHGELVLRETGITYPRPGNPEGGVLSSIIEVTSGAGRYEGATGIMFFHGRSLNGVFDVELVGTLCTVPRRRAYP